jgi:hypothetical protein
VSLLHELNAIVARLTLALPHSASEALDGLRMHLRLCEAIEVCTKSVPRARYYRILGRSAVVQVYCSTKRDRQLSAPHTSLMEKPQVDERYSVSVSLRSLSCGRGCEVESPH